MAVIPCDGAIICRDIVNKLDVLRVERDKCGRFGRYQVDRLIERYGIDAKLFDWEPEADCPRKVATNDYDPCGPVPRTVAPHIPARAKHRIARRSAAQPSRQSGATHSDAKHSDAGFAPEGRPTLFLDPDNVRTDHEIASCQTRIAGIE